MFREMRRKNRMIDTDDCLKILEDGEYGILSTVGEDNIPYGMPLNYVMDSNNIYFHCAREGHKIDNVKSNSAASFCVVGNTQIQEESFSTLYESAIVFGDIEEVSGDEKRNALIKLIEKYSPEYIEQGIAYIDRAIDKTMVLRLSMKKISGKAKR